LNAQIKTVILNWNHLNLGTKTFHIPKTTIKKIVKKKFPNVNP